MTPAEIVLAEFTVFNALQIVSYIPQIVCVVRDRRPLFGPVVGKQQAEPQT